MYGNFIQISVHHCYVFIVETIVCSFLHSAGEKFLWSCKFAAEDLGYYLSSISAVGCRQINCTSGLSLWNRVKFSRHCIYVEAKKRLF